jgi:putative glutamine amidotransferase
MTAKPLKIGISPRIFHPEAGVAGLRGKTLQYLEQTVAHWVMSREVLVFMVPSINQDALIHRSNIRLRDYAAQLDGLVLQGGADVSPMTYNEEPLRPEWSGDRVRDVYEMELLHEFVEAGKPVLGICRGMQLINVAYGGTLLQDIAEQHPDAAFHETEAFDRHAHEIAFEPGGGLAKLYGGAAGGRVVSIHHQGIKALGRDLRVEAWSVPDRVPEAIRGVGKRYLFGVQWHPEFHPPGDPALLDCTPILDEFLEAARRRFW